MKRLLPWLAIVVVLVSTACQLRSQGRLWWCSCDYLLLWAGDPWSSDNSQHLLDPYSFTHVLHGVIFGWLILGLAPRLSWAWQLWLAVAVESAWELIENSEFVIRRYREGTAALGYFGDSIVNSLGDVAMCGFGFLLVRWLGFRRSLVLFVAVEAVLLLWIRDSLILSLLMLIYPVEGIKHWQASP
jgi:uncharacterized protein DUF2585